MKKILDSAISLEVLKQDLGLLPKPREDWNTIDPVECGHYIANGIEYIFKDGELKLASECNDLACGQEECSKKGKTKHDCNTCTKASCNTENIKKALKAYIKSKESE